jgi:hypothetical protein
MATKPTGKSVTVSCRLTADEVAAIDKAAAAQSVPVDRSTLVAFIVRKWLADQGKRKG